MKTNFAAVMLFVTAFAGKTAFGQHDHRHDHKTDTVKKPAADTVKKPQRDTLSARHGGFRRRSMVVLHAPISGCDGKVARLFQCMLQRSCINMPLHVDGSLRFRQLNVGRQHVAQLQQFAFYLSHAIAAGHAAYFKRMCHKRIL